MDETISSILSDSYPSAFPLIKMGKKGCKSFGAGFSVVRHKKVKSETELFKNQTHKILCRLQI